jgi:zinc D-Ala-D-Ala carboxypeptidase
MKADWTKYPNFSEAEFNCKHTGLNEMTHEFMTILQAIRTDYGKPMNITSGYRHPSHPVERAKTHSNGEHTQGNCADIACANSTDRFALISLAVKHGITRIGIARSFLHLGIGGKGLPNNVAWDYK